MILSEKSSQYAGIATFSEDIYFPTKQPSLSHLEGLLLWLRLIVHFTNQVQEMKTQKLFTNKFYSPGQTVRIKIFTVSPSLRPANTTAKIYIIDPRGSRMAQWPDEKQSLPGIFSRNFPLTLEPVFGEWRIFAEIQGKLYNTTFTVKHYRPAKFEISVNGMKFQKIEKNVETFILMCFFFSRYFKGHHFSL